ncbi:MAG TPA: helix-turn-helix transcriptional regulator [Phycisphaerae bacterium]|nr:helix-turn-helix transcriptional regulator [Phycisphaerae bacterium]
MTTTIKHPRSHAKARKTVFAQATGVNVRTLRQQYGLSQGLLARLLDVSLRTVSGLESGSVATVRNLIQVERLCSALAVAMKSSYVGHWLDKPNEMLGNLKPVEAVERGQIDLVWQVVEGLRSGSPL